VQVNCPFFTERFEAQAEKNITSAKAKKIKIDLTY
jgi:hypothetical protein